jgi:hypothetical protein
MKTERANIHLNSLNREMRPVFDEPHTVVAREDSQKGLYIRRTYFKNIPDIAAMLLGEFLYCLRSGLDQLAWQLSTPEAKRTNAKRVYFPMFPKVENSEKRRELKKTLGLFPSDVATEIDALQPYHGPGAVEDHPLWQLHTLCNLDKHCIVPLSSASVQISYPAGAVVAVLDTEHAIEVSVPLDQKEELDCQPNAVCHVELGEWNSDLRIPFSKLADMHNFIRHTVVPKFSRFDAEIPDSPAHRADGPKAFVYFS